MMYSNTCTKCGGTFAVRKEVLIKRIVKFGSLEKLIAGYECQKCRSKNSETDLNVLADQLRAEIAAKKEAQKLVADTVS